MITTRGMRSRYKTDTIHADQAKETERHENSKEKNSKKEEKGVGKPETIAEHLTPRTRSSKKNERTEHQTQAASRF